MKRNLTLLVAFFLMSWSCNKRDQPDYFPATVIQTTTHDVADTPEKDSFEAMQSELFARIAACSLDVARANAAYKPPRPTVTAQTSLFPISGE